MVKAVTIFIDDDKELAAIKVVPLGSALSSAPLDASTTTTTSQATANATYTPGNGQTDVSADVTYDF